MNSRQLSHVAPMPCALGDSKGEIKLWHVNPSGDVPPEEPKATLNDRSSEIAHLSWHPKVPQQLAAASADKVVRQVPYTVVPAASYSS